MKKFLIVLEYELLNYFKNKSFVISTLVISIIAGIIMFVPSFVDMSSILGISTGKETVDTSGDDAVEETEKKNMLIYDKSGAFSDLAMLNETFPDVKWEKAQSEEALKEAVEKENVDAGFVVNSMTAYDYYVFNKSIHDNEIYSFDSLMVVLNQMKYCADNELDYAQISEAFNPVIESEVKVLGKDMMSNYWYCYALVIIIFMIIILYGVMVATSVTQEKSNRTIEVLVTSTSTNALFFAKVFAGAISALVQCGIMFGTILVTYGINRDSWGGLLDPLLDIPADVLVIFALFGIGGFLFYTFIYGAMGALVSKTEDINKSSGSVQMVITIVYVVVLTQLTNVDGIFVKIASYLPISSYSAMFARVAMGNVAIWEIVISFVVLVISIILVGLLGAKIYRMGTLRYGNPIKLSNALKSLKQEKEQ